MSYRIYLSPPHMSGREMKYIQDAFDSNWIAPAGPNIDAFEEELCQYTGSKYALAVSSGTAALHLALVVLGIRKGDIVLCQSLTFVATANPIMYVGATPVFIDSEPVTWNMCPNTLEDAIRHYIRIGRKPRAVIVVHLYGMPAMLDEILYLCKKHDIPMIEDAAEALGSEYRGQQVGTFGDIGVISFNGNKIITTSGGGAILCSNVRYLDKAAFLAAQARERASCYEHVEVGYNYRMSNINAGIGRGQLKVIRDRIERRRSNFRFYRNKLGALSVTAFQMEVEKAFSNYWLTAFIPQSSPDEGVANRIIASLSAIGIEARPIWKPMHCQPLYRTAARFGGVVSEYLFTNGVCLPSGSSLTEADTSEICGVVLRLIQEY